MTTDAISSILSQIRAHEMRTGAIRADAAPSNAIDVGRTGETRAPGFAQVLGNAIDQVSATQARAGALQQAFELGDPRADLARVMVAMQQSQVAFRATVEVRNRLVQAYQDVMNMPI
ncbi:flagellar hook-basal body complex protein FliE [Luteimonas wenzhouensis]|mgnify:CR=1 FL=1|jgi:flagellar hook-basal body complex protein FliE|uniref:Flagellar hook-basal body complex protein FliE n=1 Tax=Luteimonas wenzhouensis TaxID=2599615 RepID=A0A5C5TY14_9GAMM|nr:flagellar hook-basal body complex protein FliE [Luteimonas wenzhouensis]NLW97364.1 flagellar hook-basal body complex protein FliE [Xanthomonadaceae bacterium]TWT18030.1 flagellar hook-basal body complex protein FliE [Luteimonas wenzhouensis]